MSTPAPVSTTRICFRDYLALILTLLCIGVTVCIISIPLLLILVPLLRWRIRLIRQTIENGRHTLGVLQYKRFRRGEWIYRYAFKVDDQVLSVRNTVVGFVLPHREGEIVPIAYDPAKPARAFLPALYTRTAPAAAPAAPAPRTE